MAKITTLGATENKTLRVKEKSVLLLILKEIGVEDKRESFIRPVVPVIMPRSQRMAVRQNAATGTRQTRLWC